MQLLDSPIFELSPIAMWLEDFSEVQKQFDLWRSEGIEDIASFLLEDKSRILSCAHKIKVLHVNPQTLKQFEAQSFEDLTANLAQIFKADMSSTHLNELVALWNGEILFENTAVNYILTVNRLDIRLRGTVLPGHEHDLSLVLITTEDITPYANAQRLEEKSRLIAEARFQYSPTSLWVEDFSRVKARLDHLRRLGISDFKTFLDVHNDFINECLRDIMVTDVNQATLDLFAARDKDHLLKNLHKVFQNETQQTFRHQLLELWDGNIQHNCEAVNYALDGSIRHVLLHFAVFPGFEDDWGMVQLALTDITARKKAENYLEYLGKHDVLTKLYNRSFYSTEINRLERNNLRPVSCIFLDMNGLKAINDNLGHDQGDSLLRRMGNTLNQLIENTQYSASRIGGDEFVVLLPAADEAALNHCIESLHELLMVDNQFNNHQPISVSIGTATSQPNERVEDMLKRADTAMYEHKKTYYAENDRRVSNYNPANDQ